MGDFVLCDLSLFRRADMVPLAVMHDALCPPRPCRIRFPHRRGVDCTSEAAFRESRRDHPEEWDSITLRRIGKDSAVDAFDRIRLY